MQCNAVCAPAPTRGDARPARRTCRCGRIAWVSRKTRRRAPMVPRPVGRSTPRSPPGDRYRGGSMLPSFFASSNARSLRRRTEGCFSTHASGSLRGGPRRPFCSHGRIHFERFSISSVCLGRRRAQRIRDGRPGGPAPGQPDSRIIDGGVDIGWWGTALSRRRRLAGPGCDWRPSGHRRARGQQALVCVRCGAEAMMARPMRLMPAPFSPSPALPGPRQT